MALIMAVACLGFEPTMATAAATACPVHIEPPSQLLRACTTELGREAGWLHTRIELQWDGMGSPERVLGLGMPNPPSIQLRQFIQPGASMAPPVPLAEGTLLLDIQADTPAGQRPLPGPQMAVPVHLQVGYNRFELRSQLRFNPLHPPEARLYTAAGWDAWDKQHTFIAGMVLGLLLTLLGSLGMMVSLSRERSYLAYAGLALCYALGVLTVQGYLQLPWSETGRWNQDILPGLTILGALCHGAFAISFLQLRERQPWALRAYAVMLTGLVLTPLLLPRAWADQAMLPLFGLFALLMSVVAGRAWLLRIPGAHWYAGGTAAFSLCSVALFGLAGNGLNPFPQVYFFDYLKIGYLLEMSCFCAAQVQRLLELARQQLATRQRQLDDTRALLGTTQALQNALQESADNRLLLASTSHDLAQPLAALRMTVGALRSQAQLDPAHFQHLDQALLHAQTLLHTVVDQARTQHRQAAQAETVMLGELLTQVVQRHQASAQAKGLRLSCVDSSQEIRASALVLHRLLDNLVSNAVRYTQRGRVLLGLRWRSGALELQVLDTGMGLREGQLLALQRPFEQADAQAAHGHGLGLYIVRSLCVECGYVLSVRSEPGQGSCFAVQLPRPEA